MLHLADRMEFIHSDIRGPLFREALAMQKNGVEVLKLNTGNPEAVGFPPAGELPQGHCAL